MKLLYIDVNVWHINPTANLLPVLFRMQFPGAALYGPGYTPLSDLRKGLGAWIATYGPFDALVVGPHTPLLTTNSDASNSAIDYFRRFTSLAASEESVRGFFRDVLPLLPSIDVPVKLVSTLNHDTYAATEEQVRQVLDGKFCLLGPNSQFSRPIKEWDRWEADYSRKAARLSDVWHEFLVAHPERVATAVHYVAESEFFYTSLDARRWDVAVPGAEYAKRREVLSGFRQSKLVLAPKGYFHAYRVLSKLGLPVYSWLPTLRLYNILFQSTLDGARFVYTAGGGSGNMVRKFVEIPASGAVLVCAPSNGFAALGFRAGEHYYRADADSAVELIAKLNGSREAQAVAAAGQRLVMEKHSLAARGAQIAQCISAMVRGTFRGARWNGGEFIVDEAV